jgi:hypothetical protein
MPVVKPYPTAHYNFLTAVDALDGSGFVEVDRDLNGLLLSAK